MWPFPFNAYITSSHIIRTLIATKLVNGDLVASNFSKNHEI